MTTTAFDDQFTPATQTIVVVREAYDTVAILKRNVADLEVALKPQSATQAPAVPAEWRETLQEAHDTFQRYADLHRMKDTRDGYEKAKLNQKLANKLYALLQSAEVHPDDKWQLTPAPTHPADRDAREVRHD